MTELRVEVEPAWPVRLPARSASDGVARVRGGVLERLLVLGGERCVVRVAATGPRSVLFGAWAPDRELAAEGVALMRFALGVDDDLGPFYDRFRDDPLIGASVRRRPWLRPPRRPVAFEALAWAVTEQLIEYERAAAIQRRVVGSLGERCEETGLRCAPGPAAVAGCAPARLESWDLAARRALALVRAAREVACGRIDLDGPEPERGWARLRAIPAIGAWTTEILAVHGQGRYDVVPAGDLNFLKWLGRARSGGNPAARAGEDEVRALFAPYGEWAGLAAMHALGSPVAPPATARAPALAA